MNFFWGDTSRYPDRKKLGILFPLLFICLSQSSCQAHDTYKQYNQLQKTELSKDVSEKHDTIFNEDDFKLYVTPSTTLEDEIINQIDSTNNSLRISMYLLTSDSIIESIIQAQERGVKTEVLLEKSVYKLPKINHSAFQSLEKSWVQVHWSSESDINFNHSKYVILDDSLAIIWTGNFSQSTFKTNRDFFVFTHHTWVISHLNSIFIRDFHQVETNYDSNLLVVSPDNANLKIQDLILSAKSTISILAPSLEDEDFIQRIISLSEKEFSCMFVLRWKIKSK